MTSDRLTGLGRLMSGSGVVMAVGGMAVVVLLGRWELATNVLAPENALIAVGFGALAWTLLPSEPRNGAIWTYAVASFSGGAFLVSLVALTLFAPDDVLDTFIDVLPLTGSPPAACRRRRRRHRLAVAASRVPGAHARPAAVS